MQKTEILINSTEFWLIITGMLQQNWALIDAADGKTTIWFINDASEIIDKLDFENEETAERGLRRNEFRKYIDPKERVLKFIHPPMAPFFESPNFLKNFYSSGKFWW